MKSSRNRKREPRAARMLSLLTFVMGPTAAIASCSLDEASPTLQAEKSAQLACAGTISTGGSISIGGTFGRGGSIGGSGGTTGCPTADECTTWSCEEGRCIPRELLPPGDGCTQPDGTRARCGHFFPDSADQRFTYLICCDKGCLDRDFNCIPFPDQSDSSCGRSGGDCKECGECSSCNNTGACVSAPNGTDCTNGQCNNGSCCTGCIAGTTCNAGTPANCGSNGEACVNCNDNRFCTNDTCNNGTCQHTNITGPCNDGDECTTNDTCSGSSCAGTDKNCDDGNVCTTDGCNPSSGCTQTPVAGTCNDGNACTNNDSCSNGNCAGQAVNCNDGNQCTDDSCNPMMGCVHASKPEGAVCNDGSPCSTGDRCTDDDNTASTPRVCQPTAGPNCEDGNACTSDAANCAVDPPTCPHAPVTNGDPCGTGSLCVSGQTCQNGTCSGGTALDCNDQNPCTTDTCDPMVGCVRTPVNEGDECVTGNLCTPNAVCTDGECVGEPVECVALDNCHDVGTCAPDTGSCNDPRKSNGAACGTTGACQNGVCTGDGVVNPTGGTGPGTAGGGPGGGDTGGTSSAGEGSGNAGNGGSSGNGASGNTPGSGDGGQGDQGPLFQREPGGCACRVPASAPASPGYLALGLASALAFVMRRRRRAA